MPWSEPSQGSQTVEEALAAAFAMDVGEVLVTSTGVFRRVYFDMTALPIADYSGDAEGAWTERTLPDQVENDVAMETYLDNSPSSWGFVGGEGLRVSGADDVRARIRFQFSDLSVDISKEVVFARWSYTRESTQDVGGLNSTQLEKAADNNDYLRHQVDYRFGSETVYLNRIAMRKDGESAQTSSVGNGSSALDDAVVETFFGRGAFRMSNSIDAGTARPADVGTLPLFREGVVDDAGYTVPDADYHVDYAEFRLAGPCTIKWIEFLIPIFKVAA